MGFRVEPLRLFYLYLQSCCFFTSSGQLILKYLVTFSWFLEIINFPLSSISPASADLLSGSSGYLASEKTASYLHEKVHAVSWQNHLYCPLVEPSVLNIGRDIYTPHFQSHRYFGWKSQLYVTLAEPSVLQIGRAIITSRWQSRLLHTGRVVQISTIRAIYTLHYVAEPSIFRTVTTIYTSHCQINLTPPWQSHLYFTL